MDKDVLDSLERPNYFAEAQLLQWSNRDYSVFDATTNVSAAADSRDGNRDYRVGEATSDVTAAADSRDGNRDYSVGEATSDVTAAADSRDGNRTLSILQSHFNDDNSSSCYIALADDVLKDLTLGMETCSSAIQQRRASRIVADLRGIRWLACKKYSQCQLLVKTVELCLVALCKTFKVGVGIEHAGDRFKTYFLMIKFKNVQTLLEMLYDIKYYLITRERTRLAGDRQQLMEAICSGQPFTGLLRLIRDDSATEAMYAELILKHCVDVGYFRQMAKTCFYREGDNTKEPGELKLWCYERDFCSCRDHLCIPFIDAPCREIMLSNDVVAETALVEPCRSGSPDLCLLYLQYGAMPTHPFFVVSCRFLSHLKCQPIHVLLNAINQTVISCRKKHMRPGDSTDLGLIGHVIGELTGHFLCLRYLFRADPFLRFDVTDLFDDDDESIVTTAVNTDVVLHTTLDRRLRDRFLPACFTERVPSLQRQCRVIIRRVLYFRLELCKGAFYPEQKEPGEVNKFEIPKHLLRFLELKDD